MRVSACAFGKLHIRFETYFPHIGVLFWMVVTHVVCSEQSWEAKSGKVAEAVGKDLTVVSENWYVCLCLRSFLFLLLSFIPVFVPCCPYLFSLHCCARLQLSIDNGRLSKDDVVFHSPGGATDGVKSKPSAGKAETKVKKAASKRKRKAKDEKAEVEDEEEEDGKVLPCLGPHLKCVAAPLIFCIFRATSETC